MRYVTLKRTGLKTSVLACGSHITYLKQNLCNLAYNHALDRGINTIVTNTNELGYREAENKIYKAVGHRRTEFNLSIGTDSRSARLAEKDMDRSLKRFHTDYIELYQMSGLRRVDAANRVLRPDGALSALRKAKREGKILHIGVTGHNIEALIKTIKSGHVESCQFVLNMVQRQALDELVPIAKEYDVDLFVMRPLEDGWLSSKAHDALRFAFASPADVVVSGMYTKEVIDANVSSAEAEPTEEEWNRLLNQAKKVPRSDCEGCMLCRGYWTDRDGSPCPQGIPIYDLLIVKNFRRTYGLSTEQEKRYRSAVEKIKDCSQCMQCENLCIYNVPVLKILREIENEFQGEPS